MVRIKELLLASPGSSSDIKRLSDVSVRSHSDICYAPMLSAVHDARVTLDAYQLVSSPAKGTVIFLHGEALEKDQSAILRERIYSSIAWALTSFPATTP